MPRNIGDETPVGTIVSEMLAFSHPHFPVIERVIRLHDGTERAPQLLWDRRGKTFSIAAVTDEIGNYILVEENKYGQLKRFVSAPTGAVKKDESPFDAAVREFREETGFEAQSWTLCLSEPIVDFADKTDGGQHYVFSAKNARKVGTPKNPDQTALIVSKTELVAMMQEGRLPAMSMAALFLSFHN